MLSREEVNELIVTPKISKNGSTLLYDQNKLKNNYELIGYSGDTDPPSGDIDPLKRLQFLKNVMA